MSSRRDAIKKSPTKPPRLPLCPENIPAELKALDRWVVWSWERRGQQWDKPPRQLNGRMAAVNDPATLCSFQDALDVYQEGHVDGIGIALPEGITGVDLDDVRDPDTGQLDECATMMQAMLPTYAEVSPSRTGLKMLAYGHLCDKLKKIDNARGVEMYAGGQTNKYFTITGNLLPGDQHKTITGQRDGLYSLQTLISDPLEPEVVFDHGSDPERTVKAKEAVKNLGEYRADSYEDWLKVGMALKAIEDSQQMFEAWCEFSARSVKYQGPEDCEYKWESFKRRDGMMVGLGTLLRMAREDGYDPDRYQTGAVWMSTFLKTKLTRDYLIENVLVANEPAVMGGASKTLKTSLMLDMMVSLTSGVPFLGKYAVKQPVRALAISGESGEATVWELSQAICEGRGVDSDILDRKLAISFRLPYLDSIDAEHLVEECIDMRYRVVVIDPLYLAFRVGDDASNIYKMGERLGRLLNLLRGSNITPIIVHHFRKQGRTYGDPPELEDLAQSGVAEFCRQFYLLKRRKPYEYDGNHDLWFHWGGSAGHQGAGVLEAYTGTRDAGIAWRTTFRSHAEQKRHEQDMKQVAEDAVRDEVEALILEAICREPAISQRQLLEVVPRRKKEVCDAIKRLVDTGHIFIDTGPNRSYQHYLASASHGASGDIKT